jgi:rhamnosyltransferase
MSAPKISVLLPVWNGRRHLERLLPRLAAQVVAGGVEVLATDSSSEDGSLELLREHGVAVEVIPQREFRHGRTRNELAARARGEVLVFLSQDALPEGEDFLEQLVGAFEDERVAGAYGRILPPAEEDPLTARTVLREPEAAGEAEVRDLDGVGPVWDMAPAERARWLRFNNVASAIRARVLRELPFPDVPFGEDFAWAARALSAGHRIRFVPGAVVHHAHRYSASGAFERNRVDAAFHRQIHGYRVRPSLGSVLRGFLWEVREDWRFLGDRGQRWAWMWRSPGLRGGQILGQYWGSQGWGAEVDCRPLSDPPAGGGG